MECARKASRKPVLVISPRPKQSQIQFLTLRAKAVYRPSVYSTPIIESHAIEIGIGFS